MENTKRVLRYQATVFYSSTGHSQSNTYPFLKEHAREVETELHSDGIDIECAKKLIEKWNKKGNYTSIKYIYKLLTT